jgi:hypothetical protein
LPHAIKSGDDFDRVEALFVSCTLLHSFYACHRVRVWMEAHEKGDTGVEEGKGRERRENRKADRCRLERDREEDEASVGKVRIRLRRQGRGKRE